MIATIIDIFRRQAQQHKTIKAFYYNRNYELGSGNETHPMFWLEDPIYGKNKDNLFINTVNFNILFLPDRDKNVQYLQNIAFSVGLNIIERIKLNDFGISIMPDWTYLTLRDYYDNDACGCRFTVNFTQANMQNLCLIEDQFDPDKKFESKQVLPDFTISPTGNCEVYVNKFPDFNIKTRKK